MAKQIAITALALIMFSSVSGQIISRHEADSLIKSIKEKKNDIQFVSHLLQLAEFNILKTGELKTDLDSAATYMQQAATLNFKLKSPEVDGYLKLLKCYLNKEHGVYLKGPFEEAIVALKNTKDYFHLAMAELELSKLYNVAPSKDFLEKKLLISNAARHLQGVANNAQKMYGLNELNYTFLICDINDLKWKLSLLENIYSASMHLNNYQVNYLVEKSIADIHIQQGKLVTAINELSKLVQEYQNTNTPHICYVYDLLGHAYYEQGNFTKALFYAYEALKTADAVDNPSSIATFYGRLINIYRMLGDNYKMLDWCLKLKDYYSSNGSVQGVYSTFQMIVESYFKARQPHRALEFVLENAKKYPAENHFEEKYLAAALGKCYAALGQNSTAEKYFLKLIEISDLQVAKGEITSDQVANQQIGLFYLQSRQFNKARKYLDRSLLAWGGNGTSNKRLFKFGYMFKIDSAAGRYAEAIRNLQLAQQIKDSTFTVTKSKQIEELNISYETAQKQRDIISLQEKQKTQNARLQQTEQMRNWIVAAAIAMALLLAISYNRYRLKQKSNRQLQMQREEITHINKDLNHLVLEKDEILLQKDSLLKEKEHLLKEKEWLLKEVHHRVKNNLHTVICLLESQAIYLESDALKAIESCQHRIYAMSLIHQKLYQSEDVKTINMALFLAEFVQYLKESFGADRKVRFELDIDSLTLGVSQAIPVALIVNEAVTNSIKYAFPGERQGLINLSMHKVETQIILVIIDNGIGIAAEVINKRSESLGMKLIKGLSQDINADLDISGNEGTRITMVFQTDILTDSHAVVVS